MSVAKKVTLPNDFERMIPEYHKGTITYAEHIVRYQAVEELIKDKVVLDIASGSGYGTKILSRFAKKVYGVDVAKDAVAYARENFASSNIEYKVGNGERIPLDDASVDVVVSFETIEHIDNYDLFMQEVKRVLTPDGLFVVSTPNDKEFAEGNHFHLHEFEYEELMTLVKRYFRNASSYFQGTWICTALGERMVYKEGWQADFPTVQLAPLTDEQVLYFFVLCSNRDITEKITPINALGEHWSARSIQKKEVLTANHITNLSDIVTHSETHVKQLEKELQDTQQELQRIHSSRAWRLLCRIKKIKQIFKSS